MIRFIAVVLLVVYGAVATYFAWQFFNEPGLEMCIEVPKAKLLGQDLPAAWGPSSSTGQQIMYGVQDKLNETTDQAQKLSSLVQQLADEIDWQSTQNATTSGEQKNKITDVGQYLYCRQIVNNYENNHPDAQPDTPAVMNN